MIKDALLARWSAPRYSFSVNVSGGVDGKNVGDLRLLVVPFD